MSDEDYRWYHDNVNHKPDHEYVDGIVDRCADVCDDQLPLFSRVGRGLQGDSYLVRVIQDDEFQTFLEGLIKDAHTGAYTHDWYTTNINGGKLTCTPTFYPDTDPKTFTLTFELFRPDYDPEYGGTEYSKGWEFTTPPIPYFDENELGPRARTLFLRAVSDPEWTEIEIDHTPHSIYGEGGTEESYEKLIYRDDITREELHAPLPGDPETVNLTFGKGGDIDCPTTDEEEQDIQEVLNHLHMDLGGGDNLPDVSVASMKPLKGDEGNVTVWDWIEYARDHIVFEEGNGIDITETDPDANGHRKVNIAANLEAGDGIKIENHNGKKKISAHVTEVSSGGTGIGVAHTEGSPSDHVVSLLLEAGSGISITDHNNNKKISSSLTAGDGVSITNNAISAHVTEVSSGGAGIGVSHTAGSPSDHVVSILLEAGDGISIANHNNNKKISANFTDVYDHLHKDLFGGESGTNSDYAEILSKGLVPLVGDGGTITVWDWIKWWINQLTDPELKSIDLGTLIGGNPYLVLATPNVAWLASGTNSCRIPATLPATSVKAAMTASIELQYYDVLPAVYVAITPDKAGLDGSASSPYSTTSGTGSNRIDALKLGTGEMLIICKKDGSDFKPVDFSTLTLSGRQLGKLRYPQLNPENLVNTGFGWICDNNTVPIGSVYPSSTVAPMLTAPDGSVHGNWEVYAGMGNVSGKLTTVNPTPAVYNPQSGDWPWIRLAKTSSIYGYLFNRSVGNLGPRVQIDYARTYTLTYN